MVPEVQEGCDLLKILVTGGSGFIGTNLVKYLQVKGHEVVAVDDFRIWSGFRSFEPQAIVHLSALSGVEACEEDPEAAVHANVNQTISILDALHDFGGKGIRLILASSHAVLGEATMPMDEESPARRCGLPHPHRSRRTRDPSDLRRPARSGAVREPAR